MRHVEESKMRAWHFIEIRHIAAAAGAIEVYFDDPRRESAASPLKHKRRHITGRSKSLARPNSVPLCHVTNRSQLSSRVLPGNSSILKFCASELSAVRSFLAMFAYASLHIYTPAAKLSVAANDAVRSNPGQCYPNFLCSAQKLEVVLVIDAIGDGSLVVDGCPRQKVCVPGPVLAKSYLFDFSENFRLHT